MFSHQGYFTATIESMYVLYSVVDHKTEHSTSDNSLDLIRDSLNSELPDTLLMGIIKWQLHTIWSNTFFNSNVYPSYLTWDNCSIMPDHAVFMSCQLLYQGLLYIIHCSLVFSPQNTKKYWTSQCIQMWRPCSILMFLHERTVEIIFLVFCCTRNESAASENDCSSFPSPFISHIYSLSTVVSPCYITQVFMAAFGIATTATWAL